MKLIVNLIVLLLCNLVFSQNNSCIIEEGYLEVPRFFYGILACENFKGKVKEMRIDGDCSLVAKERLVYNQYGKLLEKYSYLFPNKNTEFLSEKNEYNKDGLLVYQILRDKKFGSLGNGRVGYLQETHSQETKKNYNSKGQLISTYFKSSYQNEFFLIKRNTYNSEGLLVMEESVNNHIPKTSNFYKTCKGDGYSLNDFITIYSYDRSRNLLESKIRYIDGSNRYKKEEGITTPVIRLVSSDYFTGYVKETETNFFYNDSGRLSRETILEYNQYDKSINLSEIVYRYEKSLLVERINRNEFKTFGKYYAYDLKEGKPVKIMVGTISDTEDGNVFEKRKFREVQYNPDGSFVKSYFENDKLYEKAFFNSNNDLCQIITVDGDVVLEIMYSYDNNGNWIYKEFLNDFGVKEKVNRRIAYY